MRIVFFCILALILAATASAGEITGISVQPGYRGFTVSVTVSTTATLGLLAVDNQGTTTTSRTKTASPQEPVMLKMTDLDPDAAYYHIFVILDGARLQVILNTQERADLIAGTLTGKAARWVPLTAAPGVFVNLPGLDGARLLRAAFNDVISTGTAKQKREYRALYNAAVGLALTRALGQIRTNFAAEAEIQTKKIEDQAGIIAP